MKSSMHKAAKLLNVLNTGYFHVKQSRGGKRRTLAHTHRVGWSFYTYILSLWNIVEVEKFPKTVQILNSDKIHVKQSWGGKRRTEEDSGTHTHTHTVGWSFATLSKCFLAKMFCMISYNTWAFDDSVGNLSITESLTVWLMYLFSKPGYRQSSMDFSN